MFLIPATFGIPVNMATPLVEIAIAQPQPAPTNQVALPVSAFIAASFNLTSQPLLIPIESGFSGGGAQLQAFAESGSYWLDSVTTSPVFVAETGAYWLDSAVASPVFVAETGSYWLDSVEAAFTESGSYSLDSAVASPLVVAEAGSYWLDSIEAAISETGSYWLDSVGRFVELRISRHRQSIVDLLKKRRIVALITDRNLLYSVRHPHPLRNVERFMLPEFSCESCKSCWHQYPYLA